MKKFTCRYNEMMKAAEELSAETIDGLTGSLIDDIFYSYPGGLIICLETYENTQSSIYTVSVYDHSEEAAAYSKWEERKAAYIAEYGEAAYYGE